MNDSNSPSSPMTSRQANGERPKRSSRFAWWLAGLTLGLVLIMEIPNELLSWRYAAALEARDAGKKEEASKMLAELLQRRPDDPRFLAAKYTWNKEDGKYEAALAYVQQLIAAETEGTEFFAGLLHERSQIYLHLQRYPEAIADCLELARFHKTSGRPSREEVLNSLAYSRALAGTDLDAALIDIDAAIAISRANFRDAEQLLQRAVEAKKGVFATNEFLNVQRRTLLGCVDTRGLVRYKQADYAAAQTDFDEAVESMRLVREYYRLHDDALSARERSYRDFAAKRRMLDYNDAVIYYHRSLNLRKLDRGEEAQRDWDKARELIGKEPDESLF